MILEILLGILVGIILGILVGIIVFLLIIIYWLWGAYYNLEQNHILTANELKELLKKK
jgi:hypothetical protein